MTDIVCLHRVELMAREEVILRQLFVSVIYLSFSYMVNIVDWTRRQVWYDKDGVSLTTAIN